jgi:multiple sugar transport system permease protein
MSAFSDAAASPALPTARGRQRRDALRWAGSHGVLVVGSLIMLFPFFWLIMLSLGTQAQLFEVPPVWIPEQLHFGNYPEALSRSNFLGNLTNTAVITGAALVSQLCSVTVVAYAFARLRWPGRNVFFVILLATMMVPPQVTQVPVYIFWRNLGAIDTFWPLIAPNFFGDAYLIFLARQFYMTIPLEMEEAARVDGCGYWQTFFRVVLPMAVPLMVTISLFAFLWNWNDFYNPLIYLSSPANFTLQLGLLSFLGQYWTEYPLFMANTVVILIPVVLVFLLGQRFFIKSIVLTGLR